MTAYTGQPWTTLGLLISAGCVDQHDYEPGTVVTPLALSCSALDCTYGVCVWTRRTGHVLYMQGCVFWCVPCTLLSLAIPARRTILCSGKRLWGSLSSHSNCGTDWKQVRAPIPLRPAGAAVKIRVRQCLKITNRKTAWANVFHQCLSKLGHKHIKTNLSFSGEDA